MKKKLMVLGASFPQVQLIEAAKELGITVIVASIKGNYPGFKSANSIAYVDISDPPEVLKAAKDLGIDGIATCCLDTGINAIGYVCEKMNLCGLSARSAQISSNKYMMKEAFIKNGVRTAKFLPVSSIQEANAAIEHLTLPVIIKAIDLQGSKGIYIARKSPEVIEGFKMATKDSNLNYCIIEEYIEGTEFGAQAFVHSGEVVFVLPHGDYTYMSHTAVPIGHYVPIENLDEKKSLQIDSLVRAAIKSIGLNNCAVNIDLIEKDGNIYIIELTGRVGATCLPELVSIYYGIDYLKMIALQAVGEDPLPIFANRSKFHTPNASRMLLSEKSGTIKQIITNFSLEDDKIFDFSLLVEKGSIVNKFTNAKDRIGQVVVKGDSLDYCERRIQEVLKGIQIIID